MQISFVKKREKKILIKNIMLIVNFPTNKHNNQKGHSHNLQKKKKGYCCTTRRLLALSNSINQSGTENIFIIKNLLIVFVHMIDYLIIFALKDIY